MKDALTFNKLVFAIILGNLMTAVLAFLVVGGIWLYHTPAREAVAAKADAYNTARAAMYRKQIDEMNAAISATDALNGEN